MEHILEGLGALALVATVVVILATLAVSVPPKPACKHVWQYNPADSPAWRAKGIGPHYWCQRCHDTYST